MAIQAEAGSISSAIQNASNNTLPGVKYWADYDITRELNETMIPGLFICAEGESAEWFGLPSIMEQMMEFSIHGVISHDDPQTRYRTQRAFATAVKHALNRWHRGIRLNDSWMAEFMEAPALQISYDFRFENSNIFAVGFTIRVRLSIFPSVPAVSPVTGQQW